MCKCPLAICDGRGTYIDEHGDEKVCLHVIEEKQDADAIVDQLPDKTPDEEPQEVVETFDED